MSHAARPPRAVDRREAAGPWRCSLSVVFAGLVALVFVAPTVQAQTAVPAAAPTAPAAPEPPLPVPAAKPDPKVAGAVGGTPATVIDGEQIESLLGKSVESQSGEDMGRVVDVLADKSGQMRAAVIDFGGFFGVGSRKIAVDWRSLRFLPDAKADKIIVDLPRNQLRVAPAYKEGEQVVVLGPAAATSETKPLPKDSPTVPPPAPATP